MKFRTFSSVLGLLGLAILISCSTNNGATSSTGLLYVVSQGSSLVSLFTIALSNGNLTTTTNTAATGSMPVATVMAPSGNSVFVLNGPGGVQGSISAFTIKSDGSVAAAGNAVAVSPNPPVNTPAVTSAKGIAIDAGGKFVFVASQGSFGTPSSGTISIFQVGSDGTTLTETAASPFRTHDPDPANAGISTGPAGVAVTSDSKYLYVANEFTNKVSAYLIDSTGALTEVPGSPYAVGSLPVAVTLWNSPSGTPAQTFLYVANENSNNISAFAVCNNANTNCPTPNGSLTPVSGAPFSAGLGPVALTVDPLALYLYVVDQGSNQVSGYKVSAGTGVLTALSTPTISTGVHPTAIAIHPEVTGLTTEFVYVPNNGGTNVSCYNLDTTTGLLGVAEQAVVTDGQPVAVVVK